jgi:hypothetical protein
VAIEGSLRRPKTPGLRGNLAQRQTFALKRLGAIEWSRNGLRVVLSPLNLDASGSLPLTGALSLLTIIAFSSSWTAAST